MRPSIRRALRRAGGGRGRPRAPRARGPRNLGRVPPPKIFLPGEPEDAGPSTSPPSSGGSRPSRWRSASARAASSSAPRRRTGTATSSASRSRRSTRRSCASGPSAAGLTNVRVERLDGKAFVAARLSPGCLAALHVYFPDPWPKKRHHKRRLVDAAVGRGGRARARAAAASCASPRTTRSTWRVIDDGPLAPSRSSRSSRPRRRATGRRERTTS